MKKADEIYTLVQQIPKGKVATYGQIARKSQVSPRFVGMVLHNNPSQSKTPCHRVVNAQGKVAITFAFGGNNAQQKLLEDEGVSFKNGKVDLDIFLYQFE